MDLQVLLVCAATGLAGYLAGGILGVVQRRDRERHRGAQSEIERLEAELAEQERGELQTVADRDYANDRIQAIHIALGGDGEWIGTRDLGLEAEDMAEELMARVAPDAEKEGVHGD
jgi:hypothetical protein